MPPRSRALLPLNQIGAPLAARTRARPAREPQDPLFVRSEAGRAFRPSVAATAESEPWLRSGAGTVGGWHLRASGTCIQGLRMSQRKSHEARSPPWTDRAALFRREERASKIFASSGRRSLLSTSRACGAPADFAPASATAPPTKAVLGSGPNLTIASATGSRPDVTAA
jgi:hypothetical protein